ncbi:hypothetical protein BKA65DRAFT_491453 [Rhexocercosporidium sp. MPI-PUGE-AT-0058]|nr:hypothetical protein BKA65DRAFT_491453 [Rhexocercosporidium sp. MPI-PUGE-AT-0058]
MDAFSQPLYSHLASEPQAILALSRFASSKQQFDLMAIEREEGKKAVSLDFAFNWTNYQSLSPNDTLKVTFARPRNISSITLALFSDVARPGSVDVPSSIELYSSKGLLANLSNTLFIPNDWNTFYFPEVETEFVSVNMFNKLGVFVGVCELEV